MSNTLGQKNSHLRIKRSVFRAAYALQLFFEFGSNESSDVGFIFCLLRRFISAHEDMNITGDAHPSTKDLKKIKKDFLEHTTRVWDTFTYAESA